jgi:predicted nucleotidyltransferase
MKCGSPEELAVLQWVSRQAKSIVGAKRVVLFGSRARGDALDRSDFDIAIEAEFPEKLSELRETLEENPLTLLAFDVVNLSSANPEFRERILKEAKDITSL